MNYIYRNDTEHTIFYRNVLCLPHEATATTFPIPNELGLTCLQEGSHTHSVLLHEDLIIPALNSYVLSIPTPQFSHKMSLDIFCLTDNGGVACYFNSLDSTPIPIDIRSFSLVLDWRTCSKLVFVNDFGFDVHISVSVLEVV